jgi:hypothetical protein
MTVTAARERAARALFRQHGYAVEAVPPIRRHDDEFMCLKDWHPDDVRKLIEFLIAPANTTVDITRIHVGHPEGYPGGPKHHVVRIYLRFATRP